MSERPAELVAWLRWLDIESCPCRFEFEPLGWLDKVPMGKGWVRMTTEPECPHHGAKAERERERRYRQKRKAW